VRVCVCVFERVCVFVCVFLCVCFSIHSLSAQVMCVAVSCSMVNNMAMS